MTGESPTDIVNATSDGGTRRSRRLIEAARITPPVGFKLLVPRSPAGRDIWRVTAATILFFLLLLPLLVPITLAPGIVTWLPERMIAR